MDSSQGGRGEQEYSDFTSDRYRTDFSFIKNPFSCSFKLEGWAFFYLKSRR